MYILHRAVLCLYTHTRAAKVLSFHMLLTSASSRWPLTKVLHLHFSAHRVSLDTVVSAHFTSCKKPWLCGLAREPGCYEMTQKWYDNRAQVMAAKGLKPTAACSGDTYVPMVACLKKQ
jgi:hypothetical protein